MVVAVSNSAPAPQPQAETHVSESMASTQHPAFEDKKPKSLTIRPKDLGLKVLYEPKDVDDIKLDIIAVHGIGVNPLTTWVHRETKVNWLEHETMLPKKIPHGRIMTFSYDSIWYGEGAGKHTVEQVAQTLLLDLQEERFACPHRPIIFIAHCFGGLVIQRAFTLALSMQQDYPDVADCMRGMIFLATPHNGITDSAFLTTREKVYKAITEANLHMENKTFETVIQDNEILNNVVSEFTRQVNTRTPSPQLFCFYETKPTKLGLIANIVSAPEFVIHEASGSLNGHQKRPLPLNHFNINKFEDADDNNYKSVVAQISKMVKGIDAMDKGDSEPTVKSPKRIHIPTFCAPIAPEKHFARRNNILESLDKAFEKNEKVALCGESGFGKTHIAVEYAYKFREDRPEASIYWVNANTPEQLEFSFKLIEESMPSGRPEHVSHGSLLEMVQRQLERASKTALLVVVDGLEDDSHLTASHDPKLSLLGLLPKGGGTRILTTTRSKALAKRWTGSSPLSVINVERLTAEDASFVIYGRVTKNESRVKWVKSIGNALGYSAGELSLVLHYTTEVGKKFDPEEYKRMARIPSKSKDEPRSSRSKDGPSPSWLPLQHLIRTKSNDLIDLIHVLCVMNVQCVPRSFFTRQQLDSQLKSLTEYGIIEPSPNRRVYTISALVRRSVQACLEENPESDERKAAEEVATRTVCEQFRSETWLELLPCALEVLEFKAESTVARRCSAQLHTKVSAYYQEMKRTSQAKKFLEAAMQLYESCPESEQRDIDMRETEISMKALRQLVKGVGPPSLQSKTQHTIVPTIGERRGMVEESPIRKVYERAVARHRRGSQVDIGGDGLINDYKEVSEWHRQHHGDDSVVTAVHQLNLAMAHGALRQYTEAEKLYVSALRNLEAQTTSVRDKQQVLELQLKARASLAGMYCEQGRYDDAEKSFQAVLPVQEKLLGKQHPDTLWTRHNRACLAQERGDISGAREQLRSVFAEQLRSGGLHHPATLNTARSIALNSRLQGHLQEAQNQLNLIMSLQRETLGDEHLDTVNTRRMLEEVVGDTKLLE